jgi:hypothetical protein
MNIQMYGLRELPKEVRTSFTLPGNPYCLTNRDTLKYLSDLGIFFYRDELNGTAVLIPTPEGESIHQRNDFSAFKFACIVSEPDRDCNHQVPMSVARWPATSEDRRQAVAEYEARHGDDRVWLEWNKPVQVKELDTSRVQLL